MILFKCQVSSLKGPLPHILNNENDVAVFLKISTLTKTLKFPKTYSPTKAVKLSQLENSSELRDAITRVWPQPDDLSEIAGLGIKCMVMMVEGVEDDIWISASAPRRQDKRVCPFTLQLHPVSYTRKHRWQPCPRTWHLR